MSDAAATAGEPEAEPETGPPDPSPPVAAPARPAAETKAAPGPSKTERSIRLALVAGYVGFVVFGFASPWQPRVFWTMFLPLLPLAIVLMGFPIWRDICPLAFFGELGRWANRGEQRRVPAWLERWFFPVVFGIMLSMLALRLVLTNGDGAWLGGLLVGLALVAALVNLLFTGKTWCNFFCPVGLIERIYTEPSSLPPVSGNSQCARCTACKKSCPDIHQENAYWKDLTSPGRRLAYFAFPGLVLAFYTYFWLRWGDWEAYFDGRWTHITVSRDLLLGPGFFFAPQIPAFVAALLSLLLFSAASYAVFSLVEGLVARRVSDPERRRHLVLTLAAFTAFNIFYFFAGAPTLRRLTGGTRTAAFVAPLVATLFLVKRWPRTRELFVRDRSAASLLRNWPFDEPPPADPGEVYGWIKAGEHAHEQQMTAYLNTVREALAEGVVGPGELRLLEEVRTQLGITQRDHEKVVARLSEEERHLFEQGAAGGIEERAQLDGYAKALTEAMLHHATEGEIDDLRKAFGVDPRAHAALTERLRGRSGAFLGKARSQLERAQGLDADLRAVSGAPPSPAFVFLAYLLRKERLTALERVVQLLELVGDGERVRSLGPSLFATGSRETRETAFTQLAAAVPGAEEILDGLRPLLVAEPPPGTPQEAPPNELLARLATADDRYLRAAALWAAVAVRDASLDETFARGREDPEPIVREAAGLAARAPRAATAGDFVDLATVERMQVLRCVALFADLDPDDLEELGRLSEERTLAADEELCREGDVDSDDLFVLVDGRVSVTTREGDGAGSEREVVVLAAPEVIGELALLDGSPRSATVRAKEGPIRVLRIPGHLFRTRLLERPRVARPLLATLAARIRRLSRQAVETPRPPSA